MKSVYLDHTATTPLDQRVFEAMKPYYLEQFGNASSIHEFGRRARAALDESRDRLARLLGASSSEVFFVSGGTEADNSAVKGAAWSMREKGKNHIVTSAIEHHAILESCLFLSSHGCETTAVSVDADGKVDPAEVEMAMRPQTGVVTIMHANNEVGSVQPIAAIARIARERGSLVHTDAVQTFCRLPFTVDELGVDLLSASAHKLYGPKGIGLLYIRKGTRLERLMHGGGQERGRRAGTENVPLAVGFAAAAEYAVAEMEKESIRLRGLKNRLRVMLSERFTSILLNGSHERSLPHILNVSFDSRAIDIDGEALLFNLDLAGIAVTSGSACTSGSIEPSHVLLAMGRDEQTCRATIRFSLGRSTTEEDLVYVVGRLGEIVERIGKVR